MAKKNETVKTVLVAGVLCFVCSVIVSITVVSLKPQQEINKILDKKKNILSAAGMYQAGDDVNELFKSITPVIVDMETGTLNTEIDASTYNQQKASADPKMNVNIPSDMDVANLSTRAKYAAVYLVKDEDGQIENIILPIKSKGLWSTMYGFVAVGSDTTTIKGFAYYAHGETPGLGGEVDNPKWKASWIGKKIYNSNYEVVAGVAKAITKPEHQVDSLSGATITSVGVDTSLKYWFGSHGFGAFLANVRAGEI